MHLSFLWPLLEEQEPWRGVAGRGEEGRRRREGLEARTGDGLRGQKGAQRRATGSQRLQEEVLPGFLAPSHTRALPSSHPHPQPHPHPTSLTIHVLETEAEASKAQ